MHHSAKNILAKIILGLLLGATLLWAKFPEKPITIIVHSKPGSAIDITTRQIANLSRKYCPVPILVENKSGASGVVAMRTVLNRKADGYTVLAATKSFISTILLTKSGITMNDFFFLACMVVDPEALITNRHSKVRTLEDIIRDAKAKHGKQRWLGPLVGGVDHLMAIKTWEVLGIKGEWIPYEGGSDALAALMGMQGAVYVGNPVDVLGRPDLMVAVVASPQRLPQFPDTPTFVEKGYPLKHEVLWRGYAVRIGTNAEAINYLTELFRKVSLDSAWLKFVHSTAAQPVFYDHPQFTRMVNHDQKEAIKYLEKAGILKVTDKTQKKSYLFSAVILGLIYFGLLLATYLLKREWLTGDTIIAAFLIFLGIFLYRMTLFFPVGKLTSTVGPASIPRLWIYGLWFFNLWLIVSVIKHPQSERTSKGNVLIPIRLVVLMIVYVIVIKFLGYYLSTLLFLTGGAYLLNYRKHGLIAVVAISYILFSYLVFYKILQVPLPKMLWFH